MINLMDTLQSTGFMRHTASAPASSTSPEYLGIVGKDTDAQAG
jgi:hypothetical protein